MHAPSRGKPEEESRSGAPQPVKSCNPSRAPCRSSKLGAVFPTSYTELQVSSEAASGTVGSLFCWAGKENAIKRRRRSWSAREGLCTDRRHAHWATRATKAAMVSTSKPCNRTSRTSQTRHFHHPGLVLWHKEDPGTGTDQVHRSPPSGRNRLSLRPRAQASGAAPPLFTVALTQLSKLSWMVL